MTRGAHFVLNPNADRGKMLLAKEIAYWLDPSARARAQAARRAIRLAPPAEKPGKLIDALTILFRHRANIVSAHLLEATTLDNSEPPHPLIGIEATGEWSKVSREVSELAAAIAPGSHSRCRADRPVASARLHLRPARPRARLLHRPIQLKDKDSSMPRVLIADKLSPAAVAIFKERGVEADVKTGLTKDELLKIVDRYDGHRHPLGDQDHRRGHQGGKNLKVVGRAGIGVDNVDIPAATVAGVIVMNTPFGNSITTAEHAISLMLALARELPAANASTQAGKWEKNRFMGVEITGKVLGLIGAGNIGSIVADRARGLKMRVIAYDPYLSAERAQDLNVEKVELADLLARADFITLHVPLTAETRNILSADAINKTHERRADYQLRAWRADRRDGAEGGARFRPCRGRSPRRVRGGAGQVEHPVRHEKIIATPHLGASPPKRRKTSRSRWRSRSRTTPDRRDHQRAQHAGDHPPRRRRRSARGFHSPRELGSFCGQVTETSILGVEILYEGIAADLNQRALNPGGARRPAQADAVGREHGQCADRRQGTRHRDHRIAPAAPGHL